MCEQCHQLMQLVAKALEESASANRALLAWQRMGIPKYLSQARQYNPGATSINMAYHTQSQVLLRVTTIIADVGSPGTLTIGDRTWPVNGLTIIPLGYDGMLIRPEDLVTLTQQTSGPMGLEFLGQELGDRGARW